MSFWNSKIDKLKKAIADENTKKEISKYSVCIHGDESCVRCATSDFNNQRQVDSCWQSLDTDDIKKVVYELPERLHKLLIRHPKEAVIAGGFIRALVGRETPNDIDLFVPSEYCAKNFLNEAVIDYEKADKHLNTSSPAMKYEIQTIWRYAFKEPHEVPDQFDYTVAKAAIWFDEEDKDRKPDFVGICHERFYRDIARKMLVYDCDRDVERVESIPRLLKYISYGYSIAPKDLSEVVVKTCLSLNLDSGFEGMKKQLENAYIPTGKGKDWAKMTEKYVKPAPLPERSYGYGS